MMNRMTWVVVAVVACGVHAAGKDPFAAGVRETEPNAPEVQRGMFKLPPGFEIQLVAAEPELRKPMNMAFDSLGRLWVTESREYPFPAKNEAEARDTVRVFSDFDPEGRARKVRIFADHLNIPIGIYPFLSPRSAPGNGPATTWKCIVWSIPNIWLMEDGDGDGAADQRKILFGPFDATRDTHGNQASFRRGSDGWLYATHGFSNWSQVAGSDGKKIDLDSGNTYRMRMDGSHLENWSIGQVNPFGLCFDPWGNMYSADCHSSPIYQLLRDGRYPGFGRKGGSADDGLGWAPQTIQHSHGSTAICGITYLSDPAWGDAWNNHILIGNVMTSKINCDKIVRDGSSTQGIEQQDFARCEDPWFRPVDLQWGPDGALYVADFYNRIIGHYEVPLTHPGRDRERGRIWRIIRREEGRPALVPPAMPVELGKLMGELGSPNPTRRRLAIDTLSDVHGKAAMEPARKIALDAAADSQRRANAFWLLRRFDATDEKAIHAAMNSGRREVRLAGLRILADAKEWSAATRQAVLAALGDSDALIAREAATAMGLHPDLSQVRPLLAMIPGTPAEDTHLRYILRKSLRNQLGVEENLSAMSRERWSAREVVQLCDVVLGIRSAAAAEFLLRQDSVLNDAELRDRAATHIAANGSAELLVKLPGIVNPHAGLDAGMQLMLARAAGQSLREKGGAFDAAWEQWVARLTGPVMTDPQADSRSVVAALELAGWMKLEPAPGSFKALVERTSINAEMRSAAAGAWLQLDEAHARPAIMSVVGDSQAPMVLRQQFAAALAQSSSEAGVDELAKLLTGAPLLLQQSLAAALAASPRGRVVLLESLENGKASSQLIAKGPQAEELRRKLAEAKVADAARRVEDLKQKAQIGDKALQKLIDARAAEFGKSRRDPARGEVVFKNQCAACHQIAGQGNLIGPQLDGIGSRGLERVVEDVLDPNRNVDRAFRITVISAKNNQVISGLVKRQEGGILVLADFTGKEARVAMDQIDKRAQTTASLMPAVYGQTIPESDFMDLMAYLMETRVK